jgi:ferredoxin-NADP reductase/Na+-translocating ferredoxin:NAD+ oxidoreductase RnfD subunit
MISFIDSILNRITMYRLVLYYLVALIVAAFILGFFGILPYDPTALAFSTLLILLTCWATNKIFAHVFEAQTNVESVYITALILALIISPVMAADHAGVGFLIFASVWAMASKYLFAIGKRHIFNPAAFAVALTALVLNEPATWWVGGNMALLPVVLIGGLLVVRKIQRFDLVGSFALVAFVTTVFTTTSGDYVTPIVQTLLHSSFFFLAFVMLTEPLTTPPNRLLRVCYGAFVGFLFAPNVHIGTFYMTPELALLIGNVFAYLVSPKGRYMLTLERIEQSAKDVYDFVFISDRAFSFRPGQYLEWTLGHRYPDNRGNRRYFTIASSPTEPNVRLGVKFYNPSSTFKRALGSMRPGRTISVAHLAGGFVLPKNKEKKLVFIAGGIGVTPFRSMIQYLLDMKERRPVTVFYANKTAADVAYKDIFDRAQRELGIKTIYALSAEKTLVPGMMNGSIDARLIATEVPDYRERTFYISGPRGMVDAFKATLSGMGVSRFKIKTDFFPGFV